MIMCDEHYDQAEVGGLRVDHQETPKVTLRGTEEDSSAVDSRNKVIAERVSCFSFGR